MSDPAPDGRRPASTVEADRDRLLADCVALLHAAPGRAGSRPARELGVRAAEIGLDLKDVVAAFLRAASVHWAADGGSTRSAAAVRNHAAELLTTVEELVGAAVDGYRRHARAELAEYDTHRSAFVNDLLTGRADPGGLAERAHRYGIRLSSTHTVVLARGDGLTEALIHRVDAALAARYGEGNVLTTRRDHDLVCISAGGLRGLPAELAHQLVTQLGAGGWQIGVGRSHPGLRGVATSLDEASNTLDLAARLGFATPVLLAADLLVFPVLLRDREAITDLVTSVLGPLTEARGGAQPYLDTLSVLFDHQGNQTAAARALHLSVRAVTYRLDRIKAITGYHPGEPTQRFTLQTAVLGARLLGWPSG